MNHAFHLKTVPEAPEVEAVVRTLRPLVRGKKMLRVRVRHTFAVPPQSAASLKNQLQGAEISGV